MDEQYTPGHSASSSAFMAARSFRTHGEFVRPYIKPGMKVLDCGCGPGAITQGLADAVGSNGHVTGVDFGESQIEMPQPALLRICRFRLRPFTIYRLRTMRLIWCSPTPCSSIWQIRSEECEKLEGFATGRYCRIM